jgi:NADPH:quinone reductase-like Zn-dependent oxidoreductase
MATSTTFEVSRADWSECRFVREELPELSPGEVRFEIDRFALTANNITYAVAGDMLGYWKFFPAEGGYGRIPVMGYADVVASAHDQVPVGERVFGFFPMGTHLTIQADPVTANQFMDAAPHRAETAPAYRQYARTATDPFHVAAHEDALMLLRGLFVTSFLIDDFLTSEDSFGASAFVVGSASSKTAIALGHQLSKRGAGEVIALTSARNAEFVSSLGCYDRTILYDEVESLDASKPTVLVDMSGNGPVVTAVHRHLGDQLKHSCIVGATHHDAGAREENLPGPTPTLFFAPGQIQKRSQEWGPEVFQQRLAGAWSDFHKFSERWLQVVRGSGEADLERVYRTTLAGETLPTNGHVLSLTG